MNAIVDIFDISYDGAGVGKLDGQIVFVPKTLVGEKVEVEIVKVSSSFLIGRVTKIIKASEKRVYPKCPYFDVCGGCDFQHCDEVTEAKIKLNILQKELKKVGFEGKIGFVASDKRFGYRNKIKLEYVDGKLGYFKAKSHQFFEVESCPIASEKINSALPLVSQFLKENAFKNLKSVYFKQVDENLAICFLFDKNAKKMQKNIKNLQILGDFSVFFAYGKVLESDKTQVFHILGKQTLIKNFERLQIEQSVQAFNQVNDFVAEKLYEKLCSITKNKRVVNAYSGQGFLTFLMAQKAKFVYGIELQETAHLAAEKLAKSMSDFKMQNICGKVEDCIGNVFMRDLIDIVVLDPSREGCNNVVLQQLLSSNCVNELAYISCNFSSLVRDLKFLLNSFAIEEVTIFDMFPCTANMETVVILKKSKSKEEN